MIYQLFKKEIEILQAIAVVLQQKEGLTPSVKGRLVAYQSLVNYLYYACNPQILDYCDIQYLLIESIPSMGLSKDIRTEIIMSWLDQSHPLEVPQKIRLALFMAIQFLEGNDLYEKEGGAE